MPHDKYELKPIGKIHSPFKTQQGTPIQPGASEDALATIVIYPEYVDGLSDLDGFERIWLIYSFHESTGYNLKVTPFRDNQKRGLFATRAPRRPSPIGMSTVKLDSIAGNILTVRGIDVIDGTPLLDIKPYVPEFDSFPDSKAGWLDLGASTRKLADDRFKKED